MNKNDPGEASEDFPWIEDEPPTMAEKIKYWMGIEEIKKNLRKANVPEEYWIDGTDKKFL